MRHVFRGVLRHRAKSVITAAVSLTLAVFMLLFTTNITQSQARLDNLGDELPVDLRVTSTSGIRDKSLTIDTGLIDKVLSTGMITPIRYTGRMLYLSPDFIEEEILPNYASLAQFRVAPANSSMILFHMDDALLREQNDDGADVEYLDGYDGSLFSGDDDVAVMARQTMESLGLG